MKHFVMGFIVCLVMMNLVQCKTSTPPKIEMCILKKAGGGNCTEADGKHETKLPSQMENYWCTNEADQARWASWCYDAEVPVVKKGMDQIKSNILPQ